jgi:hypothetical protein
MSNVITEKKVGEYIVRTYADDDLWNPRDADNYSKMICFHRLYDLGDKHDYDHNDYNGWEEMKKAIIKEEKPLVILPLYLYDHSGITISTSPFSCRWDSGQIGFVIATRKQKELLYGKKRLLTAKLEEYVKQEVAEYDRYLRGEGYGVCVFKTEKCEKGHIHEEEIHSCWGFSEENDAIEEGLSYAK